MKRILTFFSFLLTAFISALALGIYDGDGKPGNGVEPGSAPSDGDTFIPKIPPILTIGDSPKPAPKPSPVIQNNIYYAMDNCGSVLDIECCVRMIGATLSFSYEDGTEIQCVQIINRNTGESVCRPALWDGSTSVDVADCQGVWIVYITTTDGQTRRASLTIN